MTTPKTEVNRSAVAAKKRKGVREPDLGALFRQNLQIAVDWYQNRTEDPHNINLPVMIALQEVVSCYDCALKGETIGIIKKARK